MKRKLLGCSLLGCLVALTAWLVYRDDGANSQAAAEAGPTDQLYTRPQIKQTEDYITGRFG